MGLTCFFWILLDFVRWFLDGPWWTHLEHRAILTRERVKVNPQKSRADKKLVAPADLGNLPANTGSFVVVSGKCCLPNGPEMPRATGMSGMDVTEGHEWFLNANDSWHPAIYFTILVAGVPTGWNDRIWRCSRTKALGFLPQFFSKGWPPACQFRACPSTETPSTTSKPAWPIMGFSLDATGCHRMPQDTTGRWTLRQCPTCHGPWPGFLWAPAWQRAAPDLHGSKQRPSWIWENWVLEPPNIP